MLAHSISRGASKHALPRTAPGALIFSRNAAYWGRRRWHRRSDEADEEWKQFQLKMDAFSKQIEADPYEAIFGRSNGMLRGIIQTSPQHQSPGNTAPASAESDAKTQDEARLSSATGHHQPKADMSYDPITGRMVPKDSTIASPATAEPATHGSEKYNDPETSVPAAERSVRIRRYRSPNRSPEVVEDSLDKLTAADVRAHMGGRKRRGYGSSKQQREKPAQSDRCSNEQAAQAPNSEYGATGENSTPAKKTQSPTEKVEQHSNDGYSNVPSGLQTSFEREKASGSSLAADIQAKADHVVPDDGYSRIPMGLQTSFKDEQASGHSLANEIEAQTDPKSHVADDGYSKEPMGLQTSFAREQASSRSLADEINAKSDPRYQMADDGCSKEPMGLETSYQREVASGRSLEQDIQARDHQQLASPEDAYSHTPTGLESSYARELEAVRNGKGKSLEEELAETSANCSPYSNVCDPKPSSSPASSSASESASAPPRSVEQRKEDGAAPNGHTDCYGYSLKPLGLQTSYQRETKACHSGQRMSLEEELQEQPTDPVHSDLAVDGQNMTNNREEDGTIGAEGEVPQPGAISRNPAPEHATDTDTDSPLPNIDADEIANGATTSAKAHVYKLLAFDPLTKSLTTSQTSSTTHTTDEHPIPLSVALSNLAQPAKFVPQLTSLQRDGYEPVASAANLLIMRLNENKAAKERQTRAPRANPVDGTTIPLPPTPTMSPTGYINLSPVMETPTASRRPPAPPRHARDDNSSSSSSSNNKKVRKTEPVFSGERRKDTASSSTGRQSVKTVLTTLIWATAACYVAGVAGEVAKGY